MTSMPGHRPALVLFPGLGATEDLFLPLKPYFDVDQIDLVLLRFPDPHSDKDSFADYLNAQILPLLPVSRPLILGGFSFGGQVALELCQILQPKGLLLISSFLSADEILPRFHRQVWMSQWIPDLLLAFMIKNFGPRFFALLDDLTLPQEEVLRVMVKKLSFPFFRWSSRASSEWRGDYRHLIGRVPLLEIRGEKDEIIPKPDHRPCLEIPGGGHLVTLKQPRLVAEAINQWLKTLD